MENNFLQKRRVTQDKVFSKVYTTIYIKLFENIDITCLQSMPYLCQNVEFVSFVLPYQLKLVVELYKRKAQ